MSNTDLSAARRVVAEARRSLPPSILAASGRALYSPASTLTSGSPVYFLGLNPGEAPDTAQAHSLLTVEADLARLESGEVNEHGYLDEKWKGFTTGGAPIQVAGQQVFGIVAGGDSSAGMQLLRTTPTSNFVLRRSTSEASLERQTKLSASALASQCWPFHQAVIAESKCRVVLTHAVGIAREFARARGLGEGWQRVSGWGGTLGTLYAWELLEGPRLLALPNLSRYKPDGPRRQALAAFFQEFGPSA